MQKIENLVTMYKKMLTNKNWRYKKLTKDNRLKYFLMQKALWILLSKKKSKILYNRKKKIKTITMITKEIIWIDIEKEN